MLVELYKIIFLSSLVVGSAICLALIKHRKSPDGRLLLGFVLAILVFPLHGYLFLSFGAIPFVISKSTHSFILLYGPFSYLLLRTLIWKKSLQVKDTLHFLPFVIVLGMMLTGWDRPKYTMVTICGGLVMAYLWLNVTCLIRHRQSLMVIYRVYGNSRYFWLLLIVLGSNVLALCDIGMIVIWIINRGLSNDYWNAWVALNSLCLLLLSWFFLYRPKLFASEYQSEPNGNSPEVDTSVDEMKSRTTELCLSVAQALIVELEGLVKREKPYLKNELSLSELAASLGVSNTQLSELLNHHMNTSFYSWLNQLRFEEAQGLLASQTYKQLPIIELAFLSGFNNKNTFYRVFKQKSGMTPTEYRQSVLSE